MAADTAAPGSDDRRDDVAHLLADALGLADATSIDGLTRLSGGASRETWRFTAAGRPLVVQLQRAGDTRDMLVEAAVVGAAGAAGVPVPELVTSRRRSDGSAFMVVEAIGGETIARKIQRDPEFEDARRRFARDCGAALARIHTIDPDAVDGLVVDDQVERYSTVLADLDRPHPVFELVRNWLIEHRPDGARRAVVHGDFRLGNLIVGHDGVRAVIDWELAHLGDPMEDLGWLCVRAWRFGGAEPVGGIGSREDLFAAYEDAGGGPVDASVVRWWEVLGTWKWGIMCILQAEAHRSGAVRSHELAAIGRRVCENEYDLLRMLGADLFGSAADAELPPNAPDAPDAPVEHGDADPDGSLHDVPTAAELVEAVREWLDRDVLDATDGRLRFHTRVASNVLAMVQRELELGPELSAAHRARLDRLGVGSDRELASAIRAGDFAGREAELAPHLHRTVADKLRVANPRHLR